MASNPLEQTMLSYRHPASASPHATLPSHFIIGQDATGHWLALETHRLAGGFFTSRQSAVRFVESETGHRPGAYEFSHAPLTLSF